MKQKLALAVVLVIALVAGVVIGIEIRSAKEPGPEQVENILRSKVPLVDMFLGADLQPVETEFEDWVYPESESSGSGSNISGALNGKPFEFQTYAHMRTEDDFETVTRHYAELLRSTLGMENDDNWSVTLHGSGAAGVNGVLLSYSMDDDGERPVQVGNVGLQAKNCNLHLTITRGDEEDQTHVHVLFSRWTVAE